MKVHEFICTQCLQEKKYESDITTGYGKNSNGDKVCYQCIGENDDKHLSSMKVGEKVVLYLHEGRVQNWPNTFSRLVYGLRTSRHNIAGKRYDFWFNHNGRQFHGVQFGDNTQVAHCKLLKK